MISILKNLFNYSSSSEKEVEDEIPPLTENVIISVDGTTRSVKADLTMDEYKQFYFSESEKESLICVPFNQEYVLYDMSITQPPTLYNPEASFQTQIDIYGPALILAQQPLFKSPMKKRKRKPAITEKKEKKKRRSPRLQSKQ